LVKYGKERDSEKNRKKEEEKVSEPTSQTKPNQPTKLETGERKNKKNIRQTSNLHTHNIRYTNEKGNREPNRDVRSIV